MKYLFVKFRRDIKSLWAQFFSVFMMAMISVGIFSGMSVVWNGMEKSTERYIADTNLADAYVYAGEVTDANMVRIRSLSYIDKAEESMAVNVEIKESERNESDIFLNTFTSDTLSVMKPLVRSGAKLDENLEGIWIDEDYAREHNLKEGDSITIFFGDMTCQVEIVGTVLHSENIFFVTSATESVPNHELHGYGYLGEKYARKLFGRVICNQVRLDINDSSSVKQDTIRTDMSKILSNHLYSVIKKGDRLSITQVVDEQEQIKKMAILFSAVFILLSMLTMYTTMSRLVNNQIIQIGTMKAMGFYNSQIYAHYGLYGLVVSILGGISGTALGFLLIAPMVLKIKQSTLTLPVWYKEFGIENLYLFLLIVAICTFSAILTARKAIKGVPAQTIRGVVEQKRRKGKEIKRSQLSYEWVWTLRSVKVHKARYLMGVIAVAGSVVLMVAGVGVWDSLNSSYNEVFEKEYSYSYVGNMNANDLDKLAQRLKDYKVQYARIESGTILKEDEERKGVISALADGDLVHLYDHDSREKVILPMEGAAITYKIAREMDIKVGDTVYYQADNSSKRMKVTITCIINAKLPQGIFLSDTALEGFLPNTVYLEDKAGYEAVKDSGLVSGLISISTQRENMNEMMDSVHSIVYILIFAAFLLSAVILYNLGTLNYIERYREYATMKVLGFYAKEINSMVLRDCVLNLAAGLVIGIPLSIAFLNVYVEIVSMDNMEWTPYISPAYFIVIIGIVIVFSILINLLVCRKIRKVNMVEALKSMD
ncbi:MAG TPA: FtsX-like permease family protein [Lachnospiraceae bacterium]|nr:FtsX-like permease family protein [Lachnospiraceae bacterium]